MELEWDQEKNKANIIKHGIDFVDAVQVFQSSMLKKIDRRQHKTRIISIRRANRHERKIYEEYVKRSN